MTILVMNMNFRQALRIGSLGILTADAAPDVVKLLFLYTVDSIDCLPGPCEDYEYQEADKTIDFLTYIAILIYLWERLPIWWFRWLLLASLIFRFVGLLRFQKTRDAKTLVRFPDFFRELTIVGLILPGNMWAILAVFLLKPFVEVYLHDRK
jgi:hypothetical protein